MRTNILQYLEETASRLPEKVALSDGREGMTFSALLSAARSVGSALLQKGFSAEPVAVLMEKHPREIAAFCGIVCAGCFYVPLDPEMPPHRMNLILEQVGARAVLVDRKGETKIPQLAFTGQVLRYEELAATPEDPVALGSVRERQIDTDPIYVVFTSGSTGTPKGVVACHRSVIDYTEALCEALPFSEDTVFANQTPLYFDAPLKELMPTFKLGATVYFVPKLLFSFPTRLCDFLNEHRINTVCWVVSALVMISSLGVLRSNPPRYLRTVAFGSEVFPRVQYDLWRDALPDAQFFNLYGPTEATGMSCYWRARPLEKDEPIPVGVPFRNTGLFLVGEDGKTVRDGEVGEIYLRGTCVTMGYYGNPEKTAEAFVQNPLQNAYPETVYRTGDLGYRNANGELVFVCRKDAQIKHMGHRIELGEIEAAASDCPDVTRACCVYDAERRRIVLYCTGGAGEDAIKTFLRSRLPGYMMPQSVQILPSMPLTPNGKLDRRTLLERAKQADETV